MENIPAYDEISANLRKRAWLYLILATAVFISAFNYSENLTEWLGKKLLPNDATLVYLSPAEFLILKMRHLIFMLPSSIIPLGSSGLITLLLSYPLPSNQ